MMIEKGKLGLKIAYKSLKKDIENHLNIMKNIAIIIPTLNESENIHSLVKAIQAKVPKSTIFIVDDSKDEKMKKVIDQKKLKVEYFHRKNSSGRGSAIIYGLKKAIKKNKYRIFIEMDADFSHTPNELKRNINYFNSNNLDLLIASRYLNGSSITNWKLSRRVFSYSANFLARNLINIDIKDFTNGFRIYSPRAAKKITASCGNIGDGFIILSEIIVVLKNNNYKIDEIKTIFVNRTRGQSSVNLKLIILSFAGLLKLFFIKKRLK